MATNKQSERDRVIAASGVLCVYGSPAPSHGCACCNCTGVVELWDAGYKAGIEAAANAIERMSGPELSGTLLVSRNLALDAIRSLAEGDGQ